MPDDKGGELIPFPSRDSEPDTIDTSYEVALDDEPDGEAEPVHDGEAVALLPLDGERRPVIPAHLRTVAGVRERAAHYGTALAHHGSFHALRSPWYLLQAAGWALWGTFVLLNRVRRWWWVTEQSYLRSQAVVSGDSREWRSLHNTGRNTRRDRGMAIAACAFGALLAADVIARFAPWWAWIIVAAVALPMLARAGRPEGRPIITPSMVTPRFRMISADVVLRAYYAAGLGDPEKEGQQVTFGSPMSRDGEGSRVAIDLPYGKGLDDAMKARPALASGLDVSLSQVFLHRDPTSYRRHTLWVADRDPLAVPVGRTPLLACKPTDIWKPAPFGLDERGQLVTVPMLWQSLLVSALPRQGKTFSARQLALYAALDPYVKLDVFDFKGSPDWRKFALVADSCGFGLTRTRDGDPLEIFGSTLEAIKADVQDRNNRLSELPSSICPEGKLTREIARDPRFRMPVRLLVMDEFQEVYDLGDASKTVASLLTHLVKIGPSVGIILLDSTQRPSGVGSGQVGQQFTSFRDNHQIKFGLRTSTWQVSELCLGAGAYSEGLDTSTLLPEYKGVGILRGATDKSPTVRTYLADGRDAEKILTAARALRERAGTLSGMAAGLDVTKDERDVLADVLDVFGNDTQLHWGMLASRLERQFPERWGETSDAAVSQQCRDLGVRSADVRWPPGRQGSVRKGCYKRDVEEAAARSTAGQKP